MNDRGHVVIIGAGISGLTVAWWLARSGVRVTVLEKDSFPGGTMRTVREGEWLVETGPNSALETTPLFGQMFRELGIQDQWQYADPSSDNRFILRGGRLHVLPMSPGAFLRSSLWSRSGKLRLLKEPFVGRAKREETVAEFVERRLGREFLDYAINPFVAGVYAGNPEQLSVRSAFPKLYALEEKYGGLVKGMIKGRQERRRRAEVAKDRAKMFSFREGMQSFPDAISKRLGASVTLSAEVISIAGTSGSQGARHNGQSTHRVTYTSKGRLSEIVADAVVLSIPSYSARTLVSGISPALALALDRIYYPPVAEVFLGFRSDQCPSPLNGFGYLVPAKEERQILGTIWSSSLFPNRAPKGHIALTTFVGGSRQPELVDLDDSDLLRRVTGELGSIMGITGRPVFARIVRWKKAIPQYNLGHHQINEEIESFEIGHRGLFICSNYRGGISVGDCVLNGKKTSDNVLAGLAESRAKAPVQE